MFRSKPCIVFHEDLFAALSPAAQQDWFDAVETLDRALACIRDVYGVGSSVSKFTDRDGVEHDFGRQLSLDEAVIWVTRHAVSRYPLKDILVFEDSNYESLVSN